MQSSNNELPVEQWNQRGEQLLTVGKYEEAIEYFGKAIEICNNSRAKEEFSLDKEYKLFRSWHLQGICFYEQKGYREATKWFRNTIEIYQIIEKFIKNANHTYSEFITPWYIADVWYENGLCFSNLEDYEEANRCFDKAIEVNSKFGDAWHNKGIALGNLEKYDEALGCFDKVIDEDPNDADAWRYKGFILSKLEKYDEAIKCFDKAIELDPNAEAWNYKGITILFSPKRNDEAIECLDKALKISSNFAHAWYTKGYVVNSLGKYGEAITCFDKAIEIFYIDIKKSEDPNYLNLAYTYNNKGYAFNSLERYKEAIKCFDESLSIYETTQYLYKDIKEIKKLGQDIGYLKRGQAKYMLDDCRSALDDFKKINEDNPNLSSEKHNGIGLCYHKQQKFKKAEEEYIEATRV